MIDTKTRVKILIALNNAITLNFALINSNVLLYESLQTDLIQKIIPTSHTLVSNNGYTETFVNVNNEYLSDINIENTDIAILIMTKITKSINIKLEIGDFNLISAFITACNRIPIYRYTIGLSVVDKLELYCNNIQLNNSYDNNMFIDDVKFYDKHYMWFNQLVGTSFEQLDYKNK